MAAATEIATGSWRCAACGDASNLYAYAEAIVSGRIDGPEEVTEDSVEQIGICGGSGECRVHQSTEPIERWDGEKWVRYEPCDRCDGRGQVPNPRNVFDYRIDCNSCGGMGGRWPGLTRNPFGAH